jgi:TPR repeat protein
MRPQFYLRARIISTLGLQLCRALQMRHQAREQAAAVGAAHDVFDVVFRMRHHAEHVAAVVELDVGGGHDERGLAGFGPRQTCVWLPDGLGTISNSECSSGPTDMKRLLLAVAVLVVLFVLAVPILHRWTYDPLDPGLQAYHEGHHATALGYWLPLAKAGDRRAQRLVGLMYEHGQAVPQDPGRAVEWYRKAADQGDADGQAFLGIMYVKGQGVARDDGQAAAWFQKAAAQGSARAFSLLGDMYSRGSGVQKDDQKAGDSYRKAVELRSTAARQGDADAQAALGFAYARGNGVQQDYRQAFEWFSKAAEQGNQFAQYNLSFLFDKGLGVAQDSRQAAEWYRKACPSPCNFSAPELTAKQGAR